MKTFFGSDYNAHVKNIAGELCTELSTYQVEIIFIPPLSHYTATV